MTLVLIEGYDYLPSGSADLQRVLAARAWTGQLNFLSRSAETAFDYGYSIQTGGTTAFATYLQSARGRHTSGMVWGDRMMVPSTDGTYYYEVIDTQTGGERSQWRLAFDSFGCVSFYTVTGTSYTLVAKSPSYSFFPNVWFYLEVKWTPGYTDGSMEVRINTVPVLSLPTTRTANGDLLLTATEPGCDFLYRRWNGNTWRWDDTYLLTQSGPQNNDYLGNVRAKAMLTAANSTPLQWIIGGSTPQPTNWQAVQNIALDDTSYVYASTVGYQDFYSIDPNLNTPQVFGVEVSGAYRQDDATQRFVSNLIRSGSTTLGGISHATNQEYTFSSDIYELNPDTGVAFTGAEVNALLVGPQVDV